MQVVIIGGVAGGMSCASKLKRNLKDDVVIDVYERGNEISFGACGIPFFVSDHIKNEQELIAKTPESFKDEGINVHIFHEVLEVNHKQKSLQIKDIKNDKIIIKNYDKLVIATGARPKELPILKNCENVFTIRNVNDGKNLKNALLNAKNKNFLIIGGGFIGLEIAEACKKYNKNIIILARGKRVMSQVSDEVGNAIMDELARNDIKILTEAQIQNITKNDNKISQVEIKFANESSEILDVDIIINSIGIEPETAFIDAKKSQNQALIVDECMQTNIKDIYAAGDCSIMKSYVTNELFYAPLGTNANKQGRIIADILANKTPKPFKLIGSLALRFFDIDMAKVGINENDAKKLAIITKTHQIRANSYASYYSDEKLNIKITYDEKSRIILGAEIFGQGIVVARANYYAIAIYNKMNVDEFGFLDLCYSPPFSGVWDAALIASNTIK